MWYEKLLQVLVSKIKQDQQAEVDIFLKIFFTKIHATAGETVPPSVILGFIDKLFKKYSTEEDGSVEALSFKRDLTGLAIILMKAAFDDAYWNKDFHFETLQIPLGFDTQNEPGSMSSVSGIQSRENTGKDTELPAHFEDVSSFKGKINLLEIKTLQAWDYDLVVDFDNVCSILINNKALIGPSIFEYFGSFINKSEYFDKFICQFYLIFLAEKYITEGNISRLIDLFTGGPTISREIADDLEQLVGSSTYLTPNLISNMIKEYLNDNMSKNVFSQKARNLNQSEIVKFLDAEIKHPCQDPIVTELQSSISRGSSDENLRSSSLVKMGLFATDKETLLQLSSADSFIGFDGP